MARIGKSLNEKYKSKLVEYAELAISKGIKGITKYKCPNCADGVIYYVEAGFFKTEPYKNNLHSEPNCEWYNQMYGKHRVLPRHAK